MRNDLPLNFKQRNVSREDDERVDLGEEWFRRGGQRLVRRLSANKRSLPRIMTAH